MSILREAQTHLTYGVPYSTILMSKNLHSEPIHLAEIVPMVVIDAFEREPPPGFRGLQPHIPIRFYARHLPHWRQDGATYFVTFRLNDALPPAELEMLRSIRRRWEMAHPDPRSKEDWEAYAFAVTQKAEVWLDRGYEDSHCRTGKEESHSATWTVLLGQGG